VSVMEVFIKCTYLQNDTVFTSGCCINYVLFISRCAMVNMQHACLLRVTCQCVMQLILFGYMLYRFSGVLKYQDFCLILLIIIIYAFILISKFNPFSYRCLGVPFIPGSFQLTFCTLLWLQFILGIQCSGC
jgi:uncharacterized membrane protein YoaK (UPF0700 family)